VDSRPREASILHRSGPSLILCTASHRDLPDPLCVQRPASSASSGMDWRCGTAKRNVRRTRRSSTTTPCPRARGPSARARGRGGRRGLRRRGSHRGKSRTRSSKSSERPSGTRQWWSFSAGEAHSSRDRRPHVEVQRSRGSQLQCAEAHSSSAPTASRDQRFVKSPSSRTLVQVQRARGSQVHALVYGGNRSVFTLSSTLPRPCVRGNANPGFGSSFP
jgi:hypothetical protein